MCKFPLVIQDLDNCGRNIAESLRPQIFLFLRVRSFAAHPEYINNQRRQFDTRWAAAIKGTWRWYFEF
jgi:hypothetical protein